MEVEEKAETVGEAHPVACLETTAVLEEKEVPCDMELEIVVTSVKSCWAKGCLVVKVAAF